MAFVYSQELHDKTGQGWSEVDEPATAMLTVATPADILTAGGILRAPEAIELAAAAGLDLAAAAVVLLKESGGGRNVFGNDNVPTGGAYVKGSEVTQASYAAYIAAVNAGRAGRNGVGPMQLTWSGYQSQADQIGGCWDWRCNVTVGFQALAAHIRNSGMRGGFRDYNGSGPAAEHYADDAMSKYLVWKTRLGTPNPVGGGMTPEESQQLDEIHQQLLAVMPAWAGGITDDKNTPYNMLQHLLRVSVSTNQTALMVQQLLDAPKPPAPQLRIDVDKLANNLAAHPAIQALAPADDMGTVSFWKATGERFVRAFAVSMLSLLGAGVVDIVNAPWTTDLSISAGAAVASLLTSLVASQVGDRGSPSFLRGS